MTEAKTDKQLADDLEKLLLEHRNSPTRNTVITNDIVFEFNDLAWGNAEAIIAALRRSHTGVHNTKGVYDEPEREPPSGMVPVFTAICPKCDASYEHDGMPTEASLRGGTFCPNCKEIGYKLIGILHWKLSAAEAGKEGK